MSNYFDCFQSSVLRRAVHRALRSRGLLLLALLACSGLGGCADDDAQPPMAQTLPTNPLDSTVARNTAPNTAPRSLGPKTLKRWARSCALCHASGEAGAPISGDAQAWAVRLQGGREQLLAHTVEGLNRMPPLGYCMACETEDFIAMIEFMASVPAGYLASDGASAPRAEAGADPSTADPSDRALEGEGV